MRNIKGFKFFESIESEYEGKYGKYPEITALIENGDLNSIKRIVKNYNVDVTLRNSKLARIAGEFGEVGILKFFISKGCKAPIIAMVETSIRFEKITKDKQSKMIDFLQNK
jgi:hypothetical protein